MVKCQESCCSVKNAVFNYEEENVGKYCNEHKKLGMIDVINKRCQENGCSTHPTYNFNGQKKGLYCNEHKKLGMIDVKHERCQESGCDKQPSYNFNGQKKAIYCNEHKQMGMVDVISKRCQEPNCDKRPTYNFNGQTKAIYCNEHKQMGMVNVISKRCQEPNCDKRPTYNFNGQKKGIYCNEHKQLGMVDVISKRCQEPNCDKIPTYNFNGQTKGIYCNEHKQPGMVDVKNKRCQEPNCDTIARFALPGNQHQFCSGHKKPGMIYNPRRKCRECKDIAIYGYTEATHCELHRKENQYNFVLFSCEKCGCDHIRTHNGICVYTEDYNKRCNTKEQRILNWLKSEDIPILSHNKQVNNTTSGNKERPDFILPSKNNTHIIILEVDENQHRNYQEHCECTRMVNISQSYGKQTIFIRYNPDPYTTNKRKCDPPYSKRMEILRQYIRHYQNITDPSELQQLGYCGFIQLFYNGFTQSNVIYHPILNFNN